MNPLPAQPARDRIATGRRPVTARDHGGVDGFDAICDPIPSELVAPGDTAGSKRCAQRLVRDQAPKLGTEHLGVARLEQQPVLAIAERLLVDRYPRGDRDRAGRDRLEDQSRRGCQPGRSGAEDVGARQQLVEPQRSLVHELDALAQRACDARGRLGGPRRPHRRPPVEVDRELGGEAAQRAQEQAQ